MGDLAAEVRLLSDKDVLGKALATMVDSLRSTAAMAEQIAIGDLDARVKLLSDKDALGKSLAKMVEFLSLLEP